MDSRRGGCYLPTVRMATRQFILMSDERTLDHPTWGGHPEARERFLAVRGRLRTGPLAPSVIEECPLAISRETILAAHDEEYLLRFEEAALSGREWFDHRDNQIGEASYLAALLAAGAGPTAIDLIESGVAPLAFCAVRPPGHHAERSKALGFCFLNNAVIAARHWQQAHGRRRVLVFDFDAHHGNGIQHAFESDPDVLYVSLHEHPTCRREGGRRSRRQRRSPRGERRARRGRFAPRAPRGRPCPGPPAGAGR